MIDRIVIFKGSKKDFEKLLDTQIEADTETVTFMELIQYYNKQIRQNDSASADSWIAGKRNIKNCIVKADDYASVLEHAISNFVNIITLNSNVENLFVHNPPKRVIESLKSEYADIIEYEYSTYKKIDRRKLKKIYLDMENNIIGQKKCKKEIISSLYKISTKRRNKPIVLLLYGPSGVGKTETAKAISKTLGGELLRIQFSMMQSQEAYNYVFGGEHSRSSFAKDLECRETNIVLIDEFDKVNSIFYNAFYEMFDEGMFVDTNYQVDVRNCIFICTSNFKNEDAIKKNLGPAMFSRIGDCIEYQELSKKEKEIIIEKYYKEIINNLKEDEIDIIENTNIKSWFKDNADRYDNIRILKNKMENAIFNKLTEKFILNNKEGEN
ncbi:MAG: ATP-dependent Clp protease ATP-binding subunit [Clostridia bacterium]|nr:ATP-dependent Clp protease ATP-binding subunit [Clostridia bacterium]